MMLQDEDDSQLLVTDLEFADDAALCASNPQQLQNLINSFVAYCDKHGLTVNPRKCEVVVFDIRAAGRGLGLVTGRSRTRHCHGPASSSISVLSYTMYLAPRAQLSIA